MPSSFSSQSLMTSLLSPKSPAFAFPTAEDLEGDHPRDVLSAFEEYSKSPIVLAMKSTIPSSPEYSANLLVLAAYLVGEANFHEVPDDLLPLIKTIADEMNMCLMNKNMGRTAVEIAIQLNDKCALYFFEEMAKYLEVSLAFQFQINKVNYSRVIALLTTYTTSINRLYLSGLLKGEDSNEIAEANVHVNQFIDLMTTLEQYFDNGVANRQALMSFCFDLILTLLDKFDVEMVSAHYDNLLEKFKENAYFDEYQKRIHYALENDLLLDDDEDQDVYKKAIALSEPEHLNLHEVHILGVHHAPASIDVELTRKLVLELYRRASAESIKNSDPYMSMGFLKNILIMHIVKAEPIDMLWFAKIMDVFSSLIIDSFRPTSFDKFYQSVSLYVDIFKNVFMLIDELSEANKKFVKSALTGFNRLMQADFCSNEESFKFTFIYHHCMVIKDLLNYCENIFDWKSFDEVKTLESHFISFTRMVNQNLQDIADKEEISYDTQSPLDIELFRKVASLRQLTVEMRESKINNDSDESVSDTTFLQECLNLAYTNIFNMKIILESANLTATVKCYALLYNVFEAYKALDHAQAGDSFFSDRPHGYLQLDNYEIVIPEEITNLCNALVNRLPASIEPSPSTKPVAYRQFNNEERGQLLTAVVFKH